jgi:RND superfamily putative drug exporter
VTEPESRPSTETPPARETNGLFGWLSRLPTGGKARWIVIAFWIAVMAIAVPQASKIGDVEFNGTKAFLPGSSESFQVVELQEQFAEGEVSPAVIVYAREGGLTGEDQARIEQDAAAISEANPAWRATPPVPSEDGEAALLTILVPNTDEEVDAAVTQIREIVSTDTPDGLDVKVTGPAGLSVDLGKVFEGINGRLLVSAAIVVAVLLLITYRSPFLWIFPLVVVGFADRLATAILYGAAKVFDFSTSGQSVGIMAVLVFGAGTDYALLLIARYREELREHERPADAMVVALRQAAPAIVASGGTVMLGLACLLAADLNSNQSLGPAGIIGIFSALLLTLTLLPALLLAAGRKVFWPFVPEFGSPSDEAKSIWGRIGHRVARSPRRVWIVTTAAMLLLCLGAIGYTVSFTQADQFTDKPEAIQGTELIAAHFPAGSGAPTIVIANRDQADAVQAAIEGVDGVAGVQPAGETDTLVQYSVTLAAEPGTDEAFATVRDLREAVGEVEGADAFVGGSDAEDLDTKKANARDQEIVIPLVLLVVFAVLVFLLRSLLAPFLLLLTSLLSTLAALGVTVLIFQRLLGYDGLQAGVLLLGFVFLIALGVDYNIFLMSRVHEESPLIGTREGMLKGLAVTGGVITSAGIVLAATFAVLGILPLVALAQVGFFVSFGVLLDALVVRSVLVPAITLDLGKRIWWPSALSRRDGTST